MDEKALFLSGLPKGRFPQNPHPLSSKPTPAFLKTHTLGIDCTVGFPQKTPSRHSQYDYKRHRPIPAASRCALHRR